MEVCIDCVESAVNAFRGGAARIELCSALSEGGLTPTPGLLRQVKALVNIPLFVMIRPRRGDFYYSDDEGNVMLQDLMVLKECGADGFVFGALEHDGSVNRSLCGKLVDLASPLPCTFHRAFDVSKDAVESLESLISLGFKRLLTSGQCNSALEGASLIRMLIERAGDKITIMPGAGITKGNLEKILEATGAREFHASARKPCVSKMSYIHDCCKMGKDGNEYELLITDEIIVRAMVDEAKAVWSRKAV
ncbi:copper homeostasis protein cutC homolog [Ischnura elegans]|uniref:copper homeostasis protein cutC homolog n=1 Tax=Ischnura elegans TaxID=197161 RepID=UPI001ED8B3E4|nr:copper homeostasis protein cutC homolog [Ischnura elegans]